MMVRWSGEVRVNVKTQSELDIGGRETCLNSCTNYAFLSGFKPQKLAGYKKVSENLHA